MIFGRAVGWAEFERRKEVLEGTVCKVNVPIASYLAIEVESAYKVSFVSIESV